MSVADEEMDPTEGGDLDDTTNAAPPASAKSLKKFATKKGPKLSRGRGKPSVTLSNKAASKPSAKASGKK